MTPQLAAIAVPLARHLTQAARPLFGGGPLPVPFPAGPEAGPLAPAVPAAAPALGNLLMVAVVLFACVGYWRALARIWQTTVVAAVAYAVLDGHWDLVARWVDHFQRLFVFAVVERGVLADDPAAAWRSAAQASGPLAGGPAGDWQIAFYAAAVLVAFAVGGLARVGQASQATRLVDLQNVASRLLGAAFGGGTGYLSADFVLARLFPSAQPGELVAGGTAGAAAARLAPALVPGLAVLLLVLGVLSLGGRRKRVYEG